MDRVDGFHAELARGRVGRPPDTYIDLVIIPAVLHIDPLRFADDYPPLLRELMRTLAMRWVGGGQGINTDVMRE